MLMVLIHIDKSSIIGNVHVSSSLRNVEVCFFPHTHTVSVYENIFMFCFSNVFKYSSLTTAVSLNAFLKCLDSLFVS